MVGGGGCFVAVPLRPCTFGVFGVFCKALCHTLIVEGPVMHKAEPLKLWYGCTMFVTLNLYQPCSARRSVM